MPAPEKVYSYKKGSEKISIDLDGVVKAMLVCAEECEGQRHAASAILACNQKENHEDVPAALVALGTTWLTFEPIFYSFVSFTVSR